MKEIDVFQVNAFSQEMSKGNPASVCPLQEWMPDEVLQAIACENKQLTAFFISNGDEFELRWFTATAGIGELNLCGHGTIAAANVIFNHLKYPKNEIIFNTRFVDTVAVRRENDNWLTLDFPSWMPEPVEIIP